MSDSSITSIYVSHASEKYIRRFAARHLRELGKKTYVVNSHIDSISSDDLFGFEVINLNRNAGFSAANNAAIDLALKEGVDFFLFINPDVLLPEGWLDSMKSYLADASLKDAGVFTVPLLGYDFDKDAPTGLVDSLGIYPVWYGRWYDRGAGKPVENFELGVAPYDLPAACGALMVIPADVVRSLLSQDGYVFNEHYFMYKEDIELSVRIRRLNKRVIMLPNLPVYHCRGWADKRGETPFWARELSSRNELKMHLRYFWRYLPYSMLKYTYVISLERMMIAFSSLTGSRNACDHTK